MTGPAGSVAEWRATCHAPARTDGSTKQLASAVGEGAAAAIGVRQFLESQESKPVHMM